MIRRIVIGVAIAIGVLLVLGGTLYAFGGMWTRTPEMRAAYDERVAAGQARPLEERFVIPIPGCVCHSDDPVRQAEHSVRRMNECFGCH